MGYRSTFTTDDKALTLPQWFIDKWKGSVWIRKDRQLPISSKAEFKCGGHWNALPRDLQRVLKESQAYKSHLDWASIHLIFLHEDGLFDKYTIFADRFEDAQEQVVQL